MGAVLVCFGVQDSDYDEIRQRSKVPTPSAQSLLDRLQTSWSCGHLDDEDEDEDPVNWDAFILQSNKSTASSGSRMLSAFYSRLLEENDDCAFYFDSSGKRIKGQYFDRVELLENYFLPLGRKCSLSPHPVESLEMYNSSDDCFSTSSTLVSELDYWISSDPHLLAQRPVLGRCSSLGPPVHSSLKIHRAVTSPHLQEDMVCAHIQSPWSSQSSKLGSHQFPSPKSPLELS